MQNSDKIDWSYITVMRSKASIVLEALEQGHTVYFDFVKVAFSEDNKLCWLGDVYSGCTLIEKDRYHVMDMEFNSFMRECEKMTDDYIRDLTANISLTKIHQERAKNRGSF